MTNIILLGDFFASKFHFLSLLNAQHNTREEYNGHNSLRKSDIFKDFIGWHVMLIQINNRSRDFNKGNTTLGVIEHDACLGFEKHE